MTPRMEWISAIYADMTGTHAPAFFWDTPTGQAIAENNETCLYEAPTSNLYNMIQELPEETYRELIGLLRSRRAKEDTDADDYRVLVKAISASALRTPPPRRRQSTRYQRQTVRQDASVD